MKIVVFCIALFVRAMVASATPNSRGDTDLCRFGEIYLLRIDSGKKLLCNIIRFLCFHTVSIVFSAAAAVYGYNEHLNFSLCGYSCSIFTNQTHFPTLYLSLDSWKSSQKVCFVCFEKITALKWICLSFYPSQSIYQHYVLM